MDIMNITKLDELIEWINNRGMNEQLINLNNITTENDIDEDGYDDYLDAAGTISVCGLTLYPSNILSETDPIAYRCGYSDYVSYTLENYDNSINNYYWNDIDEDDLIQEIIDEFGETFIEFQNELDGIVEFD
jgi:hypothetical protein